MNSLHHQCIDEVGTGLLVVGRADDGTVEAVELPGSDVLAVQWHPEMSYHMGPEHHAPFRVFLEACRAALGQG